MGVKDWREARIDRDGDVPIYMQIADVLEECISSGSIKPGEPLPSEMALVMAFGIAHMTARGVAEVLRRRGLIHTVAGEGSFAGPEGIPRFRPRLPRKIADRVIERIRDGVYPAGERLPTERELAVSFETSRPTIRLAVAILVEEGWAFKGINSGTHVSAKTNWPKEAISKI